MQHHEALDRVERPNLTLRFERVHVLAERLDEPAVLHAGRARGFARPAVQAQIEVLLHVGVERQRAVDDISHQVDAATRRIGLVTSFRRKSDNSAVQETAVDTIEYEFVVDVRAGARSDTRPENAIPRERPATQFSGVVRPYLQISTSRHAACSIP